MRRFGRSRAVNRVFEQALRHPVILGCVKSSKLADDDVRGLLTGDPRAWDAFAERYLNWFSLKVERRCRVPTNRVTTVLGAAASASWNDRAREAFDLHAHWLVPGTTATRVAYEDVETIFEAAVTSGLVSCDGQPRFSMPIEVPETWSWRFTPIWDYLRRLSGQR